MTYHQCNPTQITSPPKTTTTSPIFCWSRHAEKSAWAAAFAGPKWQLGRWRRSHSWRSCADRPCRSLDVAFTSGVFVDANSWFQNPLTTPKHSMYIIVCTVHWGDYRSGCLPQLSKKQHSFCRKVRFDGLFCVLLMLTISYNCTYVYYSSISLRYLRFGSSRGIGKYHAFKA